MTTELQTCDSCIYHCANIEHGGAEIGYPDFCWERICTDNGWFIYWNTVIKFNRCKHYIETAKHYMERIKK